MKFLGVSIICLFIVNVFFSQNQKARTDYAVFLSGKFNYQKASKVYGKLHKKGGLNKRSYINYLEALYNSHDYFKVIDLVEKEEKLSYESGEFLLKSYQIVENIEAYTLAINKLLNLYPDSIQLKKYLESIEFMEEQQSKGYIVGTLKKELKKNATFPYYFNSTFVYFYSKSRKSILSKYFSRNNFNYKINNLPLKFERVIKDNVSGPVWFNDSIMFASVQNKNNDNEIVDLKLKLYTNKNEFDLPFYFDTASIAHPTYDTLNNRLYFTLRFRNKNSDIYYSDYIEGHWSNPQKMNKNINTEGDEMFPFVHEEFLYFASDGHPGVGGLDLYELRVSELENGTPVNLGRKINSPLDDFAICFKDNHSGYFSSNRKNYNDAIYVFTFDMNAKINHCLNICKKSSCVTLSHEYSMNSNLETQWILGNGDTLIGQNIQHCYSEGGEYNCELLVYDTLDNDILLFQEFFKIKIEDDLTLSPEIKINKEGAIGDTIKFNLNTVNYDDVFAQQWSFGDNQTSNQLCPGHVYKKPGVYRVSCSIFYNDTNGLQCCKTESISYINIKDTLRIGGNKELIRFAKDTYVMEFQVPSVTDENNFKIEVVNKENLDTIYAKYIRKKTYKLELSKEYDYVIRVVNVLTGKIIALDNINHYQMNENQFKKDKMLLLYDSDTIYFEQKSSSLLEKEKNKIDLIVKYLNLHPEYSLRIEGHADALGKAKDNLELSKRRAEKVKQYIANQGISGNRLKVFAYGEKKQIEPCINCSSERRKPNRRVELIIEKE